MAWYEKVLGLEDKEKSQEELDDMYNATGNSQKQVEQQGEEEKAEPTKPARAERKRAGEDVSGEQHDHTDPFKQRVGVVPDDIANHDPNKGMENDKVDVTPVKTTEGTQNGDTYRTMEDIAKIFQTRADEEEKESQENEAELKRTAKRRMLLAGIADAANSFHQAYAYARGIKPMNENKGYAKEVRKELREDLDWLRKNKDRVLNYRAKVAEIQRTIAAMKNQERQQERLEADAKTRRLVAEAKADYQKSLIAKNEANAAYYEVKANLLEAGWPLEKAIKEAELARKQAQAEQSKASANASNALAKQRGQKKVKHIRRNDLGEVEEEWYEYVDDDYTNANQSGSVSGNSNTSNAGGTSSAGNTGKGNYDQYKKKKDYSQYIKK